jgi:uncharacterized membrane protein YoaK (UPF0700 family)
MNMSTLARGSAALRNWAHPADDAVALSRLEARLPPLLSVIAGMVDLTGFFTLGHIFTAHVTGNLVVAAAAAVQGGRSTWRKCWPFLSSVITKTSTDPTGFAARNAVMIAVSAMACQYALLRLEIPGATAVTTGKLTNTVLSLIDVLSSRPPLLPVDAGRLRRSIHLLFGFLLGCVVGAAAVSLLGDWAWLFPVALAAVALAMR